MAGVFIDIPGIGNVEAKNAATESTLKDILKALQGGGAGGGGGGPGGGGAPMKTFSQQSTLAGKSVGALGKSIGAVTSGFGLLGKGAKAVVGGLTDLALKGVETADKLSRLDGSASSAVDVLSMIPGVGGALVKVFSAVANAADRMVKSYTAATASGASFGGSISSFSASASQAGMNLEEFGRLIASNGAALGAFGSTTEDGAKNFAKVSQNLRSTSSELYALGYTTQEINGGLANYGKLLRLQGAQGTKSNAELAAGAKNYLKEMDMLAKVTGESRAEKEKEREALQKDAQLRAALAGLGPDVQASVHNMIQSLPAGEMREFAKDILANGTATTDANRLIMSQMPGLAAELQRMHSQTQKGNKIQEGQINQALNQGKVEAKTNLQRIKTAVAADESSRILGGALGSMAEINTDAVKNAQNQQAATAKNTDGFNKKMQEMSQVLSSLGNAFTEILASSGILDLMIAGVKLIADLFTNLLAPALKALDAFLRPVIDMIIKVLTPTFAILGAIVEKIAYGLQIVFAPIIDKMKKSFEGVNITLESFKGAVEFIDSILNTVFGLFDAQVRGIMIAFDGLWTALNDLMQPFQDLWTAITELFTAGDNLMGGFEWMERTLLEIGSVIGEAFKIFGAVIGFAVEKVTSIIRWFTDLINNSETLRNYFKWLSESVSNAWQGFRKYFSVEGLKTIYENLLEWVDELGDGLMRWLNKISLGAFGISQEEYDERKKARDQRIQERDERLVAAKAEKDAKISQQMAEIKEDKKKFAEKKLYAEANSRLARKELGAREDAAKAAEKLVDYNSGPEALAKQFAEQQGSYLVPKDQQAAAKGDATKKQIEAQAEAKQQAEAKAAQEAQERKKAEEKVEENKGKGQAPTQESAESLLAQLNTNMAQLIKISKEQKDIGERQLSVQKSLTGDLFQAV